MSVVFRLWNAFSFRVLDFKGKTGGLEAHSFRGQLCVEKDPRKNVSI
jgi:hypothetical protein